MEKENKSRPKPIILATHPNRSGSQAMPIDWGDRSPIQRGPVVATTKDADQRNAIGTHSGAYSIYRALAIAGGELDPDHIPDLTNTSPVEEIGPFDSWFDPKKIVSLDPWGHRISTAFSSFLKEGVDIRPSIAVTQARIFLPEILPLIKEGTLTPDGEVLLEDGHAVVTKAAIEPVWHLPGIAERFSCQESELRRIIFESTGGMFPELVTRPDLKVFLPPIGGHTVYMFGHPKNIASEDLEISVRVHDECNGSDVFGSDICTCRPYLVHGLCLGIESAQRGGAGVVVYNRKEGRALGEVTKFLVYNARKRQEGGDSAEKYFERTECVAGVQDMRFQQLMPDVLHWLGVKKISRLASMSNLKYDALVESGIRVEQRCSIPEGLIPEDANVEMVAKRAAGYFSESNSPTGQDLKSTKGRKLQE